MAMHSRSFIARLTQAPARPEPELIAGNLEHLLNTRKGCGSVIAELGLGDYEAAPNTRDAVLLLRAELEQLARSYEPRLSNPRVTLLGRHGYSRIRFELCGELHGASQRFWLEIDTTTRRVEITIVMELQR